VEILYVLIPLGLVLVALGLWAFFWAAGDGQFDDLDSPGWSVLNDDPPPQPPEPAGRPDSASAKPPIDAGHPP
jgi:cbb3-type cytochrome oxidase maturation protein